MYESPVTLTYFDPKCAFEPVSLTPEDKERLKGLRKFHDELDEQVREFAKENERYVVKCILERPGVHVDEQELIRALKYDRDQYDKGYRDGYEEGLKAGVDKAIADMQDWARDNDGNYR